MIRSQDVGATVAIEVGRDDVVRPGGGDHLAIPMESAAGVEVHDDFLRTFSLVHSGGGQIEFSVAVEVGHGECVDHGFHWLFDDMFFPVAGLGVGRRLVPCDAMRAALEFRRGKDDVSPAVAVEVADGHLRVRIIPLVVKTCSVQGPLSRSPLFSNQLPPMTMSGLPSPLTSATWTPSPSPQRSSRMVHLVRRDLLVEENAVPALRAEALWSRMTRSTFPSPSRSAASRSCPRRFSTSCAGHGALSGRLSGRDFRTRPRRPRRCRGRRRRQCPPPCRRPCRTRRRR